MHTGIWNAFMGCHAYPRLHILRIHTYIHTYIHTHLLACIQIYEMHDFKSADDAFKCCQAIQKMAETVKPFSGIYPNALKSCPQPYE